MTAPASPDTPPSLLPPGPRLSVPLLATGAAAFFMMGVLQASYGPAFPYLQERYGVDTAGVGLIASAHFLGSALAPPLAGFALARVSVRRVVVASAVVLIAGMFVLMAAPVWAVAVAGALVGGLGLGGVSAALNSAYASVGTRAVNLVNAVFGVGSILSPLLVVMLAPRNLALPFLVVAALCGLTLLMARRFGVPALRPPALPQATGGRSGVQAALFAGVIACYVGLEVGFGAWAGRHLDSLNYAHAALFVSGYWGGLTLGRVLAGLFGARVRPGVLVLVSAALAAVCALMAATVPALAGAAYVLAGLSLGPVFGSTLAWMTQSLPARFIPFLLVAGSVGGIVAPALMGTLSARAGLGSVPVTLLVMAAALCALTLLTSRVTHPR
ncbi:sugar MFS transporter [Deinococcus sp. Leaf326]|uniref:MFS transporter n=1 Tax=Deinococcus sp. Leaf326 TaxID=1736338 RepID=UPI000A90FC32|nr:MFS transporter [Deinococcus sp. Leaf326]